MTKCCMCHMPESSLHNIQVRPGISLDTVSRRMQSSLHIHVVMTHANAQPLDVVGVCKLPCVLPLHEDLGLVHPLQVVRDHALEVLTPQVHAAYLSAQTQVRA